MHDAKILTFGRLVPGIRGGCQLNEYRERDTVFNADLLMYSVGRLFIRIMVLRASGVFIYRLTPNHLFRIKPMKTAPRGAGRFITS
jgi:hypothetical protein